jgi:carboxyl-terminal processing protease
MYKNLSFYLLFTLSAIVTNNNLVLAQEISEPELNFEYLWNTFDSNYGIFGAKNIDWDLLYQVYRPKVTSNTTDDELFNIMSNLLGHLNDNHVRLHSKTPKRSFQSGILGNMKMDDFFPLIKKIYLKGNYQDHACGIFSGWLTDLIGYFHIQYFNDFGGHCSSTIDNLISKFKNSRGLVIDVRENYGGEDEVVKLIADRFADQKRLYMKTYTRNGDSHNDFSPAKYWYVEPRGPLQYTKPIILLINRFSISGGETFTLAMRVLPHVTVVGDITSGCFADQYEDTLPNGWSFNCSYKLFLDHNGFCWEGVGIPADIRQTLTKQDIEEDQEKVLDLAIELINSGALKPQEELSSLKNIRESFLSFLKQEMQNVDFEEAINIFYKMKSEFPDNYYIDEDNVNQYGLKLLEEGKSKNAIKLFEICIREFPNSIVGYDNIAQAYSELSETDSVKKYLKKSIEINRHSYPWEKESYKKTQNKLLDLLDN